MIHHKKTDFIKFAEKLFIGDEHTNNHVKVFLVCSLVFYYEDMVQVIKQCPNKKYDNIKKHAMICCIDGALRDVNCTEHDLKLWRIERQKGFREQNFSQLKIQHLQQLQPDGSLRDIVVDGRSFFQLMKDIGIGVTNIANRFVDFGWSMNECKNYMKSIVSSNDETVNLLKIQKKNMELQNKVLQEQNKLLQDNLLAKDVTLQTIMKGWMN